MEPSNIHLLGNFGCAFRSWLNIARKFNATSQIQNIKIIANHCFSINQEKLKKSDFVNTGLKAEVIKHAKINYHAAFLVATCSLEQLLAIWEKNANTNKTEKNLAILLALISSSHTDESLVAFLKSAGINPVGGWFTYKVEGWFANKNEPTEAFRAFLSARNCTPEDLFNTYPNVPLINQAAPLQVLNVAPSQVLDLVPLQTPTADSQLQEAQQANTNLIEQVVSIKQTKPKIDQETVFIPLYLSDWDTDETNDNLHYNCIINWKAGDNLSIFDTIKGKLSNRMNSQHIIRIGATPEECYKICNEHSWYKCHSALLAAEIKIPKGGIGKKMAESDFNSAINASNKTFPTLNTFDEELIEISNIHFSISNFRPIYIKSPQVYAVSNEQEILEEVGKEGDNRALLYKGSKDKINIAIIYQDGQRIDFGLNECGLSLNAVEVLCSLEFPQNGRIQVKNGSRLIMCAVQEKLVNNLTLMKFQSLVESQKNNIEFLKNAAILIFDQIKNEDEGYEHKPEIKVSEQMKQMVVRSLSSKTALLLLKALLDTNSSFHSLPKEIIELFIMKEIEVQKHNLDLAVQNPYADPFLLYQAWRSPTSSFNALPKEMVVEILSRWLQVEPKIFKKYLKK